MSENAPSFEKTWRMADGELVNGEYAFVTDLDYFGDLDEPLELIEETWHRTDVRSRWVFPQRAGCYGEGEDDLDCGCDEDWVQDPDGSWMYLCAAHRAARSEPAGVDL